MKKRFFQLVEGLIEKRDEKRPMHLHEDLGRFSEGVKQSGGRAIVIVHPFFANYSKSAWYAGEYGKYLKLISKIAAQKKTPIVVLEQDGLEESTNKRLGKANPFFVKTYPEEPTPKMSWSALHDLFKKAGVRKIFLGGMLSSVSGPCKKISFYEKRALRNPPEKSITGGCVSDAYLKFIGAGKRTGYEKVVLINDLLMPEKPVRKNKRAS